MEPRVTRVRLERGEAWEALESFVLGGTYGPTRVPRGIASEVVLEFLERSLPADGTPDAYRKTLETVRFYELGEALAAIERGLQTLTSLEDLQRASLVLEAIGDLGSPEQVRGAGQVLDGQLVPRAHGPEAFRPLLQACLALAPHAGDSALSARIHEEVEKARPDERRDEAGMMHFDALAAVERNELPRMQSARQVKERLSPRTAARDWVSSYLGAGPAGGPYLEIWCARKARLEAFHHDPTPVLEAFRDALRSADPRAQGRLADFRIVRAGQAILYLGGSLDRADGRRYESALPTGGATNFLWDDP